MTTELLPPPYPETLTEIPDYPPIDCGRTIAKLRLLVSDAIRRKVFSDEEAADLMRWIDSAASL